MTLLVPASYGDMNDWPQFWRERGNAETRAVLDEAFEALSAKGTKPDEDVYERARVALAGLLEAQPPADALTAAERLQLGRAWMVLGALLASLNRTDAGVAAEAKGLALIEAATPEDSQKLLEAWTIHANTLVRLRRYADAIAVYERATAAIQRSSPTDYALLGTYLANLAKLLHAKGDYAAARPVFDRALAAHEQARTSEHSILSALLVDTAGNYMGLGEYQRALDLLRQELDLTTKAKGPRDPAIATSLNRLALVHRSLGEQEQALLLMQQALELVKGSGSIIEADVLKSLAGAHSERGQLQSALSLGERAVAICKEKLGESHPDTLSALNALAVLYDQADEPAKAVALYGKALKGSMEVFGSNHEQVARIATNLGGVYARAGSLEIARKTLERALEIRETILGPNDPDVAHSVGALASLEAHAGNYERAQQLRRRSLAIVEGALGKDNVLVAGELEELAHVLAATGDFGEARRLLDRALEVLEKARGTQTAAVADVLYSQGSILEELGQDRPALALYERASVISDKLRGSAHRKSIAITASISAIYARLSNLERALTLQERVVESLSKNSDWDAIGTATAFVNLGELYRRANRNDDAREYFVRSLELVERVYGPSQRNTGSISMAAAAFYEQTGDHARAVPLAHRAVRISMQEEGTDQWRKMSLLMSIHARHKQWDEAIFWGKQAVNAIQSVRAGLTDLDDGLQRGYLENKESVYRVLSGMLIRAGRIPEAQQVISMLRENEYAELVRGTTSAPRTTQLPLTGVERSAHVRFYAIRDDLARLGKESEELARKAKLGVITAAEEARRQALDADLAKARAAFEAFVGGLGGLLAADPQQAQSVRALQEQIKTHRALLGALGPAKQDAATLQFVASEERLHIVLTTSTVQLAREVAVARADLNRKIAAFREAVQNPRSDAKTAGRELYDLLIAPIRADLDAQHVQTLLLFLDGSLRYVPFAALTDGQGSYLIESFRLAIHTEAARTALAQRPSASWQIAALGVTRGFPEQQFNPLPAVGEELASIVRADVLPGQMFLDERFTLGNLEASLDNPVLHIASHFRFVPGSDESFLLLGDGNRLTLRDIILRDLRFDSVELLTLSACETAIGGGRNENGLEVEGLGVLAQQQGAKAVMATLWPVVDGSTGLFMQHFYRLRQSGKLNKAEALRQAQLQLLRSAPSPDAQLSTARGVTRDEGANAAAEPVPGYAHPYYWAPFILMGNWL